MIVKTEVPGVIKEIEHEVGKVVVGQESVVRAIITSILCDGHVLVEGVPGIAKTLVVKAIAKVMGCQMNRIQFTVDLLPTDITGISSYDQKRGFVVIRGPIFSNFIIADEINRSPPKTQSALLEAMQEKTVTIGRKTYKLPSPFFVMATENPVEVSGVYSLPEAQVDRFLFKIIMGYPSANEEIKILTQNASLKSFEDFNIKRVLSPEKINELQSLVKTVYSADAVKDYIVAVVNETRNPEFEYAKFIAYGASPRASISLFIASKAEALLSGRDYVTPQDVKNVAYNVLRHRILLNYEAEAERVSTDKIIKAVLDKVKVP